MTWPLVLCFDQRQMGGRDNVAVPNVSLKRLHVFQLAILHLCPCQEQSMHRLDPYFQKRMKD